MSEVLTVSSKKYFFEQIKARLLEQAPLIKSVLEFNDQFNHEDAETLFAYPAILVQFTNLVYRNQAEGAQIADAVITLHVGFTSLDSESQDVIGIVDDVNFALNGFQDEANSQVFTEVNRNAERQGVSRSNVKVWELDYSTLLKDLFSHRVKRLRLVTSPLPLEIVRISDDQTAPFTT